MMAVLRDHDRRDRLRATSAASAGSPAGCSTTRRPKIDGIDIRDAKRLRSREDDAGKLGRPAFCWEDASIIWLPGFLRCATRTFKIDCNRSLAADGTS